MKNKSLVKNVSVLAAIAVMASFSSQSFAKSKKSAFLRSEFSILQEQVQASPRDLSEYRQDRKSLMEIDQRFALPTFNWLPKNDPRFKGKKSGEDSVWASKYLKLVAKKHHLSAEVLKNTQITNIHNLGKGAIIVSFVQEIEGVEVYAQKMSMVMNQNHDLIAVSGFLASAKANTYFKLDHKKAIIKAFEDLFGDTLEAASFEKQAAYKSYKNFKVASDQLPVGIYLTQDLRAKKVFYSVPKQMIPAYYVEVMAGVVTQKEPVSYSFIVSALDGKILERKSLISHAAYKYRVFADPETKIPFDSPYGNDFSPAPAYNAANPILPEIVDSHVISVESMNSKNDPWLPDNATTLNGNNVFAFADLFVNQNQNRPVYDDADLLVTPSSEHTFDRPYDFISSPRNKPVQSQAVTTNLFYIINYMHDLMYDYGFDEASGNAQVDNMGRGGSGGDSIIAHAQDASGDNNAMMGTPADGANPEMFMYLWSLTNSFEVELTADNQVFSAAGASFGSEVLGSFTGDYVMVNDGELKANEPAATIHDGCEDNWADVTGKYVLIDRGACSFVEKVQRAEAKGALGVIILNNDEQSPNTVAGIGGDSAENPIMIPVLSVSYQTGVVLKNAINANTGDVSLKVTHFGQTRDGSVENQTIIHEWTHYLFERLAPRTADSPQQGAMHEGNGDFMAMLITSHEEDRLREGNEQFQGSYPDGVWITPGAKDPEQYYRGFRRRPYSTDMTVFPLTFKHVEDGVQKPNVAGGYTNDFAPNSEVHAAGEIWANTLWECYVELLNHHEFEDAKDRMLSYMVAAMKLMPPNMTFTEARDAYIAVAAANDPQDASLFWKAFTKRGLGVLARSPDRFSAGNQGIVTSTESGSFLALQELILEEVSGSCDADGIIDSGEEALIKIKADLFGEALPENTLIKLAVDQELLEIVGEDTISLNTTDLFANEFITFKVKLKNIEQSALLSIKVTVEHEDLIRSSELEALFGVNYDNKEQSSASDDVESDKTSWLVHSVGTEYAKQWHRKQLENGQHIWQGPNQDGTGSMNLVSPVLEVSADDDFIMTFEHAYSFEADVALNMYYDGAVIELSLDEGASWQDVKEYVDPGYDAVIRNIETQDGATAEQKNPLADRPAFAGKSDAYPKMQTLSLNFKDKLAKESVIFRFRIASDPASGDLGWQLDNFVFQGIDNTPFYSIVAEDGECADGSVLNPPNKDDPKQDDPKQDDPKQDDPSDKKQDDASLVGNSCGNCSSGAVDPSFMALIAGLLLLRRRRKFF